MTARVWTDGTYARNRDSNISWWAIREWCKEIFGEVLPITCTKDYDMLELWDDRAVQVEANTGRIIGRSTRGLE